MDLLCVQALFFDNILIIGDPFGGVVTDQGGMLMDSFKGGGDNDGTEETTQAEMPYYLMCDSIPCLYRPINVAVDEVKAAVPDCTLGILGRFKRQLGQVFRHR